MELHRPKEEKTPFVCQLTFTAAGGVHGDIVQVSEKIYPDACLLSDIFHYKYVYV